MGSANNRSGRMLNELLICSSLLAVAAIGVGIAITAGSREERPADQGEPVSIPAPPDEVPVSAALLETSRANGRFAVDISRELLRTEPDGNLFISPFSISTILTTVAEGASGETLDQMIDALHIAPNGLEEFHSRQRDLQRAVTPAVPPELAAQIKLLRTGLKDANDRTEALKQEGRMKDAVASYRKAERLAEGINSLMKQVSAYELQIANAMWMEASYPVATDFLSMIKSLDGTGFFSVDFKSQPEPARRQINEWVAQQTNNRIQNLLDLGRITDQSRLVLTNTVYFRGDWAAPFPASRTRPGSFQRASGRYVEVPMMQHWMAAGYAAVTGEGDLFPTPREIPIDQKDDDPSLYPDARGHTLVALDYQGRRVQMILIVPRSPAGLSDIEKSLSYETLEQWLGYLDRRLVQVSIPKFKLDSKRDLREPLKGLGMQRCFTPSDAQFEKLSSSTHQDDRLFISDVVHQTYVDVSEVGTEAAAATAVGGSISEGGFETPKTRLFTPIFKADRPFLFLIRDRPTASILFLGRYVGPQP